jgi:hypothetical protein
VTVDVDLLALAAEDFLPVILSAVGFVVLARLSAGIDGWAGRLVWWGGWLIVLGGLTKPIYKSLLAASGGAVDVLVLDDVLFWMLAPGFVLAAAGLRAAARLDSGRPVARLTWAPSLAIATVLGALVLGWTTDGEVWFLLLLGVSTVGNLWAVAVLVGWSLARGEQTAAAMFVLNVTIVFGLAWAAASLPQTIPVQWVEQLASTAAQGLFLYGAVRLARVVAPTAGRPGDDHADPRSGGSRRRVAQ